MNVEKVAEITSNEAMIDDIANKLRIVINAGDGIDARDWDKIPEWNRERFRISVRATLRIYLAEHG